MQVRLLHQVGRFRRHPEDAFGLLIGNLATPAERLIVEICDVTELSCREKICLDICERSLDTALPIWVIKPVGAELEAERAGECRHLRRDDRIGTGTGS